ncbi:hypothetical protein MCT03_16990 [Vibrio aestuarianus]|uniref:hypothetical protein n=1 Tax=Vibrio aestuarianus TaxID=28171 RepID=UPI00237C942F|nr:hypothetical protein [Vibrio aestuarianus]MDE1225908.1 hypothetical protein [Vibrio aestuarianus]MDE1249239.1 hypothetical protein [Vibrio aestuarianus]MDE1341031.1 hypothetical protein [Vibrio aestuarianus]MDE1351914.1 hypothetical protein [Vibrio aestuarianus]
MSNLSLIRTHSLPSLPLDHTMNHKHSLAVKGITNTGMRKLPLHRQSSVHKQRGNEKLFENKRPENLTGGKNELGNLEKALKTARALIVSKPSDLSVIHNKSINKFVFHSIFGFGISHSDSPADSPGLKQKITHAALAKHLFGTAKFVTSAGIIKKDDKDNCYVIDNNSGHYAPDDTSLIKVKFYLESLGCSVKLSCKIGER